MFTILLDSSNTSLTVGLAKDNEMLESISYEAWQSQSEHMIPELNKLLDKYGATREEIKEVAVAVGPGSYTGVRIAITIAKTIAAVIDCKVYTISSLDEIKDVLKGAKEFALYINNSDIHFATNKSTDYVVEFVQDLFSIGITFDDAINIFNDFVVSHNTIFHKDFFIFKNTHVRTPTSCVY